MQLNLKINKKYDSGTVPHSKKVLGSNPPSGGVSVWLLCVLPMSVVPFQGCQLSTIKAVSRFRLISDSKDVNGICLSVLALS